jgi:steroid delta-isomerase-like uncharacterized protein
MTQSILALGLCFVFCACGSAPPEPPATGGPPPPGGPPPAGTAPTATGTTPGAPPPAAKLPLPELQKRFLSESAKAWAAHDAKALSKLYAEDVTFGYPAIGGWREQKSRAAIEANMADFFRAFPDVKVAPERGFVSKNVLVMQWIVNGTHSGDFMGVAPTKKKVGYHGVSVMWFRDDGLVSREHMYYDDTSFLAQLGLAPKGVKGRPVAEIGAGDPNWQWAKGDEAENKNAELAKTFQGTFEKKDAKAFLGMLADDVAYSDYMQPADSKGKPAAGKSFSAITVAFPDIKIVPTNVWAAGDSVIIESQITGTFKAMFGYTLPTKKTGTLHSLDVMQFRDGKLVHGWSYGSSGEFAWAFGLLPKEAPKKDAPKVADPKTAPKPPAAPPAMAPTPPKAPPPAAPKAPAAPGAPPKAPPPAAPKAPAAPAAPPAPPKAPPAAPPKAPPPKAAPPPAPPTPTAP